LYKKNTDEYLIECDNRISLDLSLHIKQFKLKSKVAITDQTHEWVVHASWNQSQPLNGLNYKDDRCNWDVSRSVVRASEAGKVGECGEEWYDLLRMTFGIAEGPVEIPRSQAIPFEYNIDITNGSTFYLPIGY